MGKSSWNAALSTLILLATVTAKLHLECDIISEIQREEQECLRRIKEMGNASVSGCGMVWDHALCWPSAEHGETVNMSCPAVFLHFSPVLGVFTRNCTKAGWSDVLPVDMTSCLMNDTSLLDEDSDQNC